MKNKKGLLWFILLTFIPTYLVELFLFLKGFSFIGQPQIFAQLTVAVAMFFPGISAFIVRKFITREGFSDAGLKLGKRKFYLQVYLLIPLFYAIIYGLTWLLVQAPDFSLQSFMAQYGLKELPFPQLKLILLIFISTITYAPFLNAIPAFGEEFGWRGYLLPKLLPFGQKKALIISGIIWGLWHAPLVLLMGFHYGHNGWLGVLFFTTLVMLVGIYFGYLRIVSGSVFLTAFAHGVFNAQFYGIWSVIFPNLDPFLGGVTSLIGILVFLTLSLWVFKKSTD